MNLKELEGLELYNLDLKALINSNITMTLQSPLYSLIFNLTENINKLHYSIISSLS